MCLAVDTAVPSLAPRRLHSYTAVFAICPTKEMAPPLPNATCVPISSAAQATTRPARCSRWRGRSRTTSGTGRRSAFALSPAQLPVIAAPKRDPAPRHRGTKEREARRSHTQLPVIAAPKRETMQQLPVIAAPKRDPAPRYRGTKEREDATPPSRHQRDDGAPRHRGTKERDDATAVRPAFVLISLVPRAWMCGGAPDKQHQRDDATPPSRHQRDDATAV